MACLETYATLRIFSESLHPDEVSRILGLDGTSLRPVDPTSRYRHERESNLWLWSTKSFAQTADGLEHIGMLIAALDGKDAGLRKLQDLDCKIDVCCYWLSTGDGGPSLDSFSLSALARLGLDIWWDVYFEDPSESGTDPSVTSGCQ